MSYEETQTHLHTHTHTEAPAYTLQTILQHMYVTSQ